MRKKIKRPPKYCEECGTKLRSNYRPQDAVCSQPKWNGTAYSKCQRARLIRLGRYSIAQDTTGKKCKVCDKVMEHMTNANQSVCKRPPHLRRYFAKYRTDCEIKNQATNGDKWKKVNRRTKKEKQEHIEFFVGKEDLDMLDYAPLVKPYEDNKQRRCLGILSHEGELGDHFFKSKGPYNRVCPLCVESAMMRDLDHNKDESVDGYPIAVRSERLSKRSSAE